VHAHDDAQTGVNGFEFFADQPQRDVIEPCAAILFRDADAQYVKLSHLVQN
jgi:hypothetical protein